jgi:hypothetical protein
MFHGVGDALTRNTHMEFFGYTLWRIALNCVDLSTTSGDSPSSIADNNAAALLFTRPLLYGMTLDVPSLRM